MFRRNDLQSFLCLYCVNVFCNIYKKLKNTYKLIINHFVNFFDRTFASRLQCLLQDKFFGGRLVVLGIIAKSFGGA